jgi:putative ABC transport system permease protein
MLHDLKFALRLFNAHRGYAATAILTVALGVGANTAVFSVADAVLFRPLPYPDSSRLFMLRMADLKTGQAFGRLPDANAEAALATGLFDASASPSIFPERAYIREGAGLGLLELAPVPPAYLDLLGVRPVAGRAFTPSDAGTRAVLLSYRTWMRRYGGDAAIVGASIDTPSRGPLRVVGILPADFRNPLLFGSDGVVLFEERLGGGPLLVRLKRDAGLAAAEAQLNALQGPGLKAGVSGLRLVPLREELAGRQSPVLWLLVAAAAVVLAVACVNLGNLIAARGAMRERELAIRAAIGGSRLRLTRLLLVESGCLALFGAVAGVVVAYLGVDALGAQLPPALARAVDPAFDARALGFATAIACVSCIAFGTFPAWRLARADRRDGLRLGGLQSAPSRHGRRVLVAVEVAMCLALLVGASLVGRTLLTLTTRELGFEPHRVVATFEAPARPTVAARIAFVEAKLAALRSLPNVYAAGAASALPFGGNTANAPLFDGAAGSRGGVYNASTGLFRAMGIRLLAGRDFTEQESFTDAPVGVLNETAAKIVCGSVNCLGRVIQAPRQPARTVIGVVADVRLSLVKEPAAVMYVPFDRTRFFFSAIVIGAEDTPQSRDALQRVLSDTRDVRVTVTSLAAARDREVSPYRFNAIIIGAFGALTLALAIVGVYGVMSAIVGERTREYGIRLALGATRERVNRHVLRLAALPIGAGIVAGVVAAAWLSQFVASLLFGVVPLDVPSFALAVSVLIATGFLAALVPARRAGRVDPIIALRAE